MFGIMTVDPAPLIFSSLQVNEERVKSADFTNLLADGDTGLSTPTVVITRLDGTTISGTDVRVVSGPAFDATDKIISVTVGGGQQTSVDYWITFSAVGATSGLVYSRSVKLGVRPALG